MSHSKLSAAARQLIESSALAHFVTINGDGSPQVAVVWVALDGDEIVSAHLNPNQQKLRNLRRDPRVAISIETSETNEMGLTNYLVVHGRARLSEGGAPELLQQLAHVYIGPDVRFPPMDDPPTGVITHVEITKIGGNGPWSDAT